MIMVIKFIFNFCNFSTMIFLLTRLLTLGILFSTVVNVVFLTKLLISEILFYNLVRFAFLTKPVTLGFFFLILFYQCYT